MSEQLAEQPVIDQPITEADIAPDPPDSIAEHRAQFSPEAQAAPEPELKPIRPVDQQKRHQGQFAEGRKPMKAKDAVERINQLTGRAKSAEERLAAAEAEVTRLRTQHASPAKIEAAEQRVETAERRIEQPAVQSQARRDPSGFPEPEPAEDDPKFEGDYSKYLRAAAAWEGRKAYWTERTHEQQQASQARVNQHWDTRIAKAVGAYPDYMAAVEPMLSRLPANSPIYAFVANDDSGEDVLYYLSKNPQELDAILRTPGPMQQLKALSLLSQRFASPTPEAAGATGSAARRTTPIVLPKPPNPVRTEAQRASDGPPPTDGSLSIAEHRKRFGPSAR